jgi:adenosine deaminase CECR1
MVDYLHSKLPVVISSDDPGLWGSEGLSHEFNVALMCWNLGLLGIKKLALNSIEYSITTPEEKKKFQSLWNEKYDIFIKKALQAKEKYVKAQQKQI